MDLKTCYLFADDCLVVNYGPDCITSAKSLELDLINYSQWYKSNFLVLNAAKTEVMTLSKSKINHITLPIIKFENMVLKQSDKIKYLGCHLDNRLNLNKHLSMLKKKLYPVIKNFMSNRRFLTENIAAIWYKTLIRPVLEYCAPIIYGGSKSLIKNITSIENKCLKIISSNSKSITRLNFNIPFIEDRLKYLYILAFFKLTHGYVPSIDDILIPAKVDSVTRLGATGGYLLGVSSGAGTTLTFGAALFNSLPQHIRGLSTLYDFKKDSKAQLLNNIQI
jgi:hypothetical protein